MENFAKQSTKIESSLPLYATPHLVLWYVPVPVSVCPVVPTRFTLRSYDSGKHDYHGPWPQGSKAGRIQGPVDEKLVQHCIIIGNIPKKLVRFVTSSESGPCPMRLTRP